METNLTITTLNSRGLRANLVLPVVEGTHMIIECQECRMSGWHDTHTDGSVLHPDGILRPSPSAENTTNLAL